MTAELATADNLTIPKIPAHAVLAEHADAIRTHGRRIVTDVVEIGRRLSECRDILKEDGNWRAWLKAEFAWGRSSADNFINIYKLSKSAHPNFGHAGVLSISTLYALAAPTTPEPVREAVLELAAKGKAPSLAQVRTTIATAKGRTVPPPPLSSLAFLDASPEQRTGFISAVGRCALLAAFPAAWGRERLEETIHRLEFNNAALLFELEEAKSALEAIPSEKLLAEIERRLPAHQRQDLHHIKLALLGEEPVITAEYLRVVS